MNIEKSTLTLNSSQKKTFLLLHVVYLIIWFFILLYVKTFFSDRFAIGLLIFASIPLSLSLKILVRWKYQTKKNFVLLGTIAAFMILVTPYILYDWSFSEEVIFHKFTQVVKDDPAFEFIKSHPRPKDRKGVNRIEGYVLSENDYLRLSKLAEKYKIYGIEEIQVRSNSGKKLAP